MIKINSNLILSNDYKEIKNKSINEQIVLNIMNDSSLIFNSTYRHSKDESNGESDFYDINDENNIFDTKMILYSEICEHMEKGNVNEWFEEIKNELNEIYTHLSNSNIERIRATRFYTEIKTRLDNISDRENLYYFSLLL